MDIYSRKGIRKIEGNYYVLGEPGFYHNRLWTLYTDFQTRLHYTKGLPLHMEWL